MVLNQCPKDVHPGLQEGGHRRSGEADGLRKAAMLSRDTVCKAVPDLLPTVDPS